MELRKRDIAELKDSIKIWKNEVIVGTQKMIIELRYEEERLRNQIKKQQEKIDKAKEEIYAAKKERDEIKNSCSNYIAGTIVVCIFVVLIAGIIISLIWTFEKNSKVEKYSDTVETRKPALKIADNPSELDIKQKKLEEELNNESDIEKRIIILDKILNIGKENK